MERFNSVSACIYPENQSGGQNLQSLGALELLEKQVLVHQDNLPGGSLLEEAIENGNLAHLAALIWLNDPL